MSIASGDLTCHFRSICYNSDKYTRGREKRTMQEIYDSRLVAGKLRRWSHYLQHYRLPTWEQIPTLGLYMDQVLTLLSRYLPFLPKKEKEEQIITTSAINNYVRMKLMPAPEKKKYNRIHIAYLIMICALKQSLTMSEIQKILPNGLTEDEVKKTYEAFVDQYTDSARVFVSMVESMAAQLLAAESADAADVNSFVLSTAVMTNFSRLLTTKLLDLQNAPFTEEAVALWNPEE